MERKKKIHNEAIVSLNREELPVRINKASTILIKEMFGRSLVS